MGLTKAKISNLDTGEEVQCLFNPTEYTVSRTNNWQPKPVIGKNVPKLDFAGGGGSTLTMELFFDTYEQGDDETGGRSADVRTYTEKLWKLSLIDESSKNPETRRGRPPLCLFEWGPSWTFKAVITSLSIRYTLFRQDGTPVRAVANVSLQEAQDDKEQPGTNPTSRAEPGLRRREVKPMDTLPLISYEEYGDPNHWRLIAERNEIDDPTAIQPGDILAIPPLP